MTVKEYLEMLYGQYELVETLSSKSTSSVLLLRHRSLQKNIVVRSSARRLAVAEYLRSIVFPNLPEVYDTVLLEDGEVILEEALEGRTLDKVLAERNLSFREAREILSAVSDALIVIHEAGFVHRDIKPKNILITETGTVKLIDFGASRAVRQNDDTVRLGTAGFAAPEQYVGASDHRADIFALGVLLNVMLTGKHPSEALPKNRHARRIIEKATSMNPDKRFSSAEEFKRAL
ncbi:MAG: serine/threonine protein kinase [Lachnospiraceae bacterium]|nr:serine/threonine protein kinase [Lachnospiraceae bacterium]